MPGETTMLQKSNREKSPHIIIFLKLQNVRTLWYQCISSAKSKLYLSFTLLVLALSVSLIALFINSPPLQEKNAAESVHNSTATQSKRY